jgi:very-short-patch-repair endonuclease/DNA polymerase III delta prime subunit
MEPTCAASQHAEKEIPQPARLAALGRLARRLISVSGNDYLRLNPEASARRWIGLPATAFAALLSAPEANTPFPLSPVGPNKRRRGQRVLDVDIPADKFLKAVSHLASTSSLFQREKGLDTLFVVSHLLRWFREEKDGTVSSHLSPLLLLGAGIESPEVGQYDLIPEERPAINPVLREVLSHQFNIVLPEMEVGDEEDAAAAVERTIALVRTAIEGRDQWDVEGFSGLAILRSSGIPQTELDPEGYSETQVDALMDVLVDSNRLKIRDEDLLVESPEAEALVKATVLPVDSSQLAAMVEVARGHSLLIQGPPGTGKSQTIVNLIANAVERRQSVLFLAQKKAAHDVVLRRLDQVGLKGKVLPLYPPCSHKEALYLRIKQTLDAAGSSAKEAALRSALDDQVKKMRQVRGEMTSFQALCNKPIGNTGLTLSQVMGLHTRSRDDQLLQSPPEELFDLSPSQLSELTAATQEMDAMRDGFVPVQALRWTWLRGDCPHDLFALQDLRKHVEDAVARLGDSSKACWPLTPTQIDERLLRAKEVHQTACLRDEIQREFSETFAGDPASVLNLASAEEAVSSLMDFSIWNWVKDGVVRAQRKALRALILPERQKSLSTPEAVRRLLSLSQRHHGCMMALELQGVARSVGASESAAHLALWQAHVEQVQATTPLLSGYVRAGRTTPLSSLVRALRSALDHWSDVHLGLRYNQLLVQMEAAPGCANLAEQAYVRGLSVETSVRRFLAENWARHALKCTPNAGALSGLDYEKLKAVYQAVDQQICETYRSLLAALAPATEAHGGNTATRVPEKVGYTLLQHVAAKPNCRVTPREVLQRAHQSLRGFCPVFMCTPSTVADLLPKDMRFDLLIIDEASQMLTEEAAGAVLRARQLVVVGDSQQMPPSSLMSSRLEDDDAAEDESKESILDRAVLALPRERRLLYHYRSMHNSLIDFSNEHFYERSLICPPAARVNDATLGVHLHPVQGTYYPKPSTEPNPVEAKAVVAAMIDHCIQHPEESLGVATMNIRQMAVLTEMFAEVRQNNPAVQAFCRRWQDTPEDLFIKNLENVQGDERDVIIVSTVFGRDAQGQFSQGIGINRTGDERRINVLITRAKKRVAIYTSINPGDITTPARGPQLLRRYLEYAGNGGKVDHIKVRDKNAIFDSPWEELFYDRLTRYGFTVDAQVGVHNFRVDLGIRHPDDPYSYICGLELDGAAYHSSLSARDRDIVRQQILEAMGWKIIRVWSTDFFRDPEGGFKEVLRAIEALRQGTPGGRRVH